MTDKEFLKIAQEKLNEKRKSLVDLETKKADIMKRFQNAKVDEQQQIAQEMQISEKQFEKLLQETTELAEKIARFKKTICG